LFFHLVKCKRAESSYPVSVSVDDAATILVATRGLKLAFRNNFHHNPICMWLCFIWSWYLDNFTPTSLNNEA